jgi:acyl transferase domain-containing protein/acyl carrier protein
MAGRFPGAPNIAAFWNNLRDGVESIAFYSEEELRARRVDPAWLNNPHFVPARPEIADRELFDAGFFGYSAQEAEIIDPQQRVFLETAWEALEHAGYAPERAGGLIGVYAGSSQNTYVWFNLLARPGYLERHGVIRTIVGNGPDYLATRTAHKLDLRGPAISVQTACSTSLVAIHLACQGLLNFECDMALAGGVSLRVTPLVGYLSESGGLMSRDGHCRAFAADASGTIFGEGVGVVTLKRLEDAERDGDTIHAVILGSAVNNDGSQKAGFTAPAPAGQAAVVFQALENAAVSADSISYVEAHGTGTELGDPIEVKALTGAFEATTKRRGFCALGTVKTNIGHLDAAAGVAGLIKTVLALEHRALPPTLHFDRPNPGIDFAATPFFVNAALREWRANDGPRRAGVSAFGIGGTNAHIVIEEAQQAPASASARTAQVIVVSARSASALARAATQLAAVARTWSSETLADAAYTLSVGRRAFPHRLAVIGRTGEEIAAALAAEVSPKPAGEGRPSVAQGFSPALVAVAEKWMSGAEIDWTAFWGDERRRRIPLPTYPFERSRYWSEPDERQIGLVGRIPQVGHGESAAIRDWASIPVWKQTPPPQRSRDAATGWMIVGDDHELKGELERLVKSRGERVTAIADANRVICIARDTFFAPLALLQSLPATTTPVRVAILTSGAHTVIGGDGTSPEGALADGLARVAAREFPHVTTRVVDAQGADIARVIDELESDDREPVAVYRNGRRWVQEFEPVPLAERATELPALRDGAVWLVTGGTGGLGLEIASALTSRFQAKVALVGRHATQSPAIARLRASGADVLPIDADVSDTVAIAAAVETARDRFGRIDGVIHAAGIAGGGLIALKTSDTAAAVIAPKVAGTRALLAAVASRPPQLVVLFSSIASIVGNVGQADYAAANAYLDAVAQSASSSATRVISINWDAWQDVGMAADNSRRGSIPPSGGVEAFFRVLALPFAQVVISPAGVAARMAEASAPTAAAPIATRHPRPALGSAYVAARNAGEHALIAIWEELLGTSGIGIDDNFFELGGDSLLATQLIARLRAAFGHEWSLRELMTHATVAALATAIEARQAAPALADAALLAEIDALSDEEAEARLRSLSGRAKG